MNNKYDVYGIGNALVDKEFSVDEDFFSEVGLQKGFMELIDQKEQEEMLELLRRRYGLRKRAGGGSAANTLFALSQFGANAFYSCKVANDETGDFYMQELGHHNIETNLSPDRDPGSTGRCLVMITPDAERTMLTHLGISQDVSPAELRKRAIADSSYVYIEGYLVTSDSARAAIREMRETALENNSRIALTFSDPSMVKYFSDGINEVIDGHVDLLFCNQQEAMLWSGEDTLEGACRRLENVAGSFVVTRGAEGALLYDGHDYREVPSYPVKAVDTTGAGDMFAGAFLYGLSRGYSFVESGKLANLAAATVISSYGPRLQPAEHAGILEKFHRQHSA